MTVHKKLTGDLSHLGLGQLFRLLDAAKASGTLRVEAGETSLELPVVEGATARPSADALATIRRLMGAEGGRFRFQQAPGSRMEGRPIPLSILDELAERGASTEKLASDLGLEELLRTGLEQPLSSGLPHQLHQLPSEVPENPLVELLEDLQDLAPDDLHLAEVGVVSADPRLWRGTVERRWKRHGWEPLLLGGPEADLSGVDLLVVHHQLSITRVGREEDWLELVKRAAGSGIPVVWIGPLGDPRWLELLVEAGAGFLLPPPPADSGEPLERFHRTLTAVIGRILEGGEAGGAATADPIAELAEALFGEDTPGGGVEAVLQLASRVFTRAAVLRVESTRFRTWAGYGYPLSAGLRSLPRGIALLERAARERELVRELPEPGQGRRQLARLLGLEELPDATSVVPLQAGARTVALLVGDGEGGPGEGLDELARLAPRLGMLLRD